MKVVDLGGKVVDLWLTTTVGVGRYYRVGLPYEGGEGGRPRLTQPTGGAGRLMWSTALPSHPVCCSHTVIDIVGVLPILASQGPFFFDTMRFAIQLGP